LKRHPQDSPVVRRLETYVESAIGIEPGEVWTTNTIHRGELAADQNSAIGLLGNGQDVPVNFALLPIRPHRDAHRMEIRVH
jgi:hypothetical protein